MLNFFFFFLTKLVSDCRLVIGIFEKNRRSLIKQGLIKEELGEKVCIKRIGNYSNCDLCGVTQICTLKVRLLTMTYEILLRFQDPITGEFIQKFKTPLEKSPLYSIGDEVSISEIILLPHPIF